MKNTVYCIASTEPQANDILMHLRNLAFSSSEVSVLLKAKETKNISIQKKIEEGAILIAVHSDHPAQLDRAVRVFKSSGAEEVYSQEDLAA